MKHEWVFVSASYSVALIVILCFIGQTASRYRRATHRLKRYSSSDTSHISQPPFK